MNEAIKQRLEKVEDNSVEEYDFVKVVRCKDCKYCEKSFCSNHRDYCEKHSTLEHTEYVNSTDYCSKGERKENE